MKKILKITISNGISRFHLGHAAAELEKLGMLAKYITAGYPTRRIRSVIELFNLATHPIILRLLDRAEKEISETQAVPLWWPEFFVQLGAALSGTKIGAAAWPYLTVAAMKIYQRQASTACRKFDAPDVYHYRAGFGGASVSIFRERGSVCLCDHSIAHPRIVDAIVSNKGKIPTEIPESAPHIFWRTVEQDLDRADHIIVNSDYVKETMVAMGCDPDRVHVVYAGVDSKFMESIHARSVGETPALTFAGTANARKGFSELVASLTNISAHAWKLNVVGGVDPDTMDEHKKFLNKENVCLHGYISRDALSKVLCQTDIFILPTLCEGSARVVFEAMACGCYIITTKNAGSIVEDGVHGRIVPPGDEEALRQAIAEAISNRSRCKVIGQKNAELVKTEYAQDRYGYELKNLYEKLCTRI